MFKKLNFSRLRDLEKCVNDLIDQLPILKYALLNRTTGPLVSKVIGTIPCSIRKNLNHCIFVPRKQKKKEIYLFFGNSHVILDIGEYCWFNKVTFVTETSATGYQLGTFLLTAFYQRDDFIKLFSVDLNNTKMKI